MKIQNISGSILVVTIADIAARLEVLGTATFPDTEAANADFLKLVTTGKIRIVNSGAIVGAVAATTARSVGDTTLVLKASTGVGKFSPGDKFKINGDDTIYTVLLGTDEDISDGTAPTITFYPGLVKAIASAAFPSITLASDVRPLDMGVIDASVATITGATGTLVTGDVVTVHGVTFEFTALATTALTTSTNTRIRLDLYTTLITQFEALREAINASTVLRALGVVANPFITNAAKANVPTTTSTCITLTASRERPFTVSNLTKTADNITVQYATTGANILGVYHNTSRRQELFNIVATQATHSIYSGFSGIDSVMVQVRTSAGVNKFYDGAVTTYGGWINLGAGTGGATIAATNIITLLVSGY